MILRQRPVAVAGPSDLLNRCGSPPCDRPGATPVERRSERVLRRLAGIRGPWVAGLPEVAFLRVRAGNDQGGDAVYSLIDERAHTNVAYMFGEDSRLIPADDTLTVARGYLGSYPNFAFDVEVGRIEEFGNAVAAVQSPAAFEQVAAR